VIQVAMGWEGIHLYDFHFRAERYSVCPHKIRFWQVAPDGDRFPVALDFHRWRLEFWVVQIS